jgi:hypothetical protein
MMLAGSRGIFSVSSIKLGYPFARLVRRGHQFVSKHLLPYAPDFLTDIVQDFPTALHLAAL